MSQHGNGFFVSCYILNFSSNSVSLTGYQKFHAFEFNLQMLASYLEYPFKKKIFHNFLQII